jgi:hypothetical protein
VQWEPDILEREAKSLSLGLLRFNILCAEAVIPILMFRTVLIKHLELVDHLILVWRTFQAFAAAAWVEKRSAN